MIKKQSTALLIRASILTGAVSILTACGIDAPKAEIAYAEASIHAAQNMEASSYAAAELERAKNQLKQSKSEVKDDNNERALRLAKESAATAELAQAKAENGKAKLAESQMQESLKIENSHLK